MIITLLFGGVTYVAGIVTGVLLREKEIVTCADLSNYSRQLATGARIIVAKVREECTVRPPVVEHALPTQPCSTMHKQTE